MPATYYIEYAAKIAKEVLESIRIGRYDFIYTVQRMDARERAKKVADKQRKDVADTHSCTAKISAQKNQRI